MGWFDEQVRGRLRRDDENFSDAMEEISSILTREQPDLRTVHRTEEQQESITDAIHQILRYYRLKPGEIPTEVKDPEERIEHLCRPFIQRTHFTTATIAFSQWRCVCVFHFLFKCIKIHTCYTYIRSHP